MLVVLHPEARAELASAAFWYDEQRIGLGGEFLAEVAEILQRIESSPGSFPRWLGSGTTPETIFKAVILRFPYVLAFERWANQVLVLAVAHGRRRPLYWMTRRKQR